MNGKKTRPFESAQKTSQLKEGEIISAETAVLNRYIDQYIAQKRAEGLTIPVPPTDEDIDGVLELYRQEHRKLKKDERGRIRLTIATMLEARLRRF